MELGKAVVGQAAIVAAYDASSDDKSTRVFVRPHDLEIDRYSSGEGSVASLVQRIQSAGPLVRVELASEQGEPIIVELPHARQRELSLRTGESVFVKVRDAQVFVAGEQI